MQFMLLPSAHNVSNWQYLAHEAIELVVAPIAVSIVLFRPNAFGSWIMRQCDDKNASTSSPLKTCRCCVVQAWQAWRLAALHFDICQIWQCAAKCKWMWVRIMSICLIVATAKKCPRGCLPVASMNFRKPDKTHGSSVSVQRATRAVWVD